MGKSKIFIFVGMDTHEKYMRRCLELTQNGLGTTYPNPLVGSVIVYNDTIIGEGWHYKAGQPHAEVMAVQSVKDTSLLKNSTIYVSLEPCNHTGKTPPCCDLIIAHQIPKVVVGTTDPFEKVNGSGIKRLQDAGIDVTVGILEDECKQLNQRFFTYHTQQRPYIILKWAQSLDGYMAPELKSEQKPVWISNAYSRQLVHLWRTQEQAIMVGTKTVLEDNPRLDARDWKGSNPVRIVIDQHLVINPNSHVLDNSVKTIMISEKTKENHQNTFYESIDFYRNIPEQITQILYKHQIQSVIIEGGSKTLQQFIEKNLWNEARVFISPESLTNGVNAPKLHLKPSTQQKIIQDTLLIYHNSHD